MNELKKTIVMTAESGTLVLTPYAMARTAHHLFNMARSYDGERDADLARHFLYCASIEIGLKAAILATACTPEGKTHIRSLGHDLLKVKASFEKRYSEPVMDASDAFVLERINPHFKSKGLEYFTIEVLVSALKAFGDIPTVAQTGAVAAKVNAFVQGRRFFVDA